jgi:hypothetical protein
MKAEMFGDGIDSYCFTMMLRGKANLVQSGMETTGADGARFRSMFGAPRTLCARMLTPRSARIT